MKILFLHGLESKPGGSKVQYLRSIGHDVLNPALPKNDFEESVRIAQEEIDTHNPDVVVGSSRGGAVAMAIRPGSARLVLIAPAWKRFGVPSRVPSNTTVLHCVEDDLVDISDSESLDGANIVPCGSDHRMSDPDALESLRLALTEGSQLDLVRRYVRELLSENKLRVFDFDDTLATTDSMII